MSFNVLHQIFFREMPFSTNFIFVKCRFPPNVQKTVNGEGCGLHIVKEEDASTFVQDLV